MIGRLLNDFIPAHYDHDRYWNRQFDISFNDLDIYLQNHEEIKISRLILSLLSELSFFF